MSVRVCGSQRTIWLVHAPMVDESAEGREGREVRAWADTWKGAKGSGTDRGHACPTWHHMEDAAGLRVLVCAKRHGQERHASDTEARLGS